MSQGQIGGQTSKSVVKTGEFLDELDEAEEDVIDRQNSIAQNIDFLQMTLKTPPRGRLNAIIIYF